MVHVLRCYCLWCTHGVKIIYSSARLVFGDKLRNGRTQGKKDGGEMNGMYKEGRRSTDGDCLEVQGRTQVTIKFRENYGQTTLAGAWGTVLHRVKTARPRHACECGGRML